MHFSAGVILPARITKNSDIRQIKHAVKKLLLPFSEEFKLKPYIQECDCIVESRSIYKKRNKRYGKADPSCGACNGTGEMKTTYNIFALFDWWQIGGNWDGDLAGTKRSSSSLWRNCTVVRDLPKGYEFWAILTPKKKWYGKWQFMAHKGSKKKKIALWNQFKTKLLKKYSKNLVVLIDFHG